MDKTHLQVQAFLEGAKCCVKEDGRKGGWVHVAVGSWAEGGGTQGQLAPRSAATHSGRIDAGEAGGESRLCRGELRDLPGLKPGWVGPDLRCTSGDP